MDSSSDMTATYVISKLIDGIKDHLKALGIKSLDGGVLQMKEITGDKIRYELVLERRHFRGEKTEEWTENEEKAKQIYGNEVQICQSSDKDHEELHSRPT